jgi:pantoate--beta-alanine ligase
MRELERESSLDIPACARLAIVGRGRLGTALAASLRRAGIDVDGPLGRGADATGADAVLLCVPDGEIARAAELIAPGRLVGHCSGASGLDLLSPHEAFSLHPLMTVTREGAEFAGAGAAVAGSTPRALELGARLAKTLGMRAAVVDEADRTAYHAAASIASNFLITLEAAAERLAAGAGVPRTLLVPLVRATVENWSELGPERALTGPVARGDEATVQAQRTAIRDRAAELLPLFDELTRATRELASRATSVGTGMRTVRTVAELRTSLAEHRGAGRKIGLVPTMGALHEGHLSLIRRARADCDVVVVSLFVNPSQFDDAGDLDAYPRDEARDATLAESLGANYLFAPAANEVYPRGFSTTVSVASLTEILEGAERGRAHFDGVTTVVTKLFNMVLPDVAYFGQKDAQQALVIRRLVRDLDIPVQVEVCTTVREPDGLALSSRNVHLSADERHRATALHRALETAHRVVAEGERDPEEVRARALSELAAEEIQPDYLALVSTDTLEPVKKMEGEVLALVAARVGATRLIDNELLSTAAPAGRSNDNGRS